MRWKTILNTAKKKVYELWHKDKYVLSVTYNSASGTARIDSQDEKRMFMISKEGILKNKTILRNEYGFRVGKLGQENKESFIELDGERFFYTIRNNGSSQLLIYKENPGQPLLVCDLSPVASGMNKNTFETGGPIEIANDAVSMLMSLCWLLFQPFAKTKATELTVA